MPKSTCYCRSPGFNSQNSHGSSQLSITSFPKCICYTNIQVSKTLVHIKSRQIRGKEAEEEPGVDLWPPQAHACTHEKELCLDEWSGIGNKVHSGDRLASSGSPRSHPSGYNTVPMRYERLELPSSFWQACKLRLENNNKLCQNHIPK